MITVITQIEMIPKAYIIVHTCYSKHCNIFKGALIGQSGKCHNII